MKLFEIQIPVVSNENNPAFSYPVKKEFSPEHHSKVISLILELAGGYSWLPEIQGAWDNGKGKIIRERMIPIRVACTDAQIEEIAKFAKVHYKQESIFVAELGTAKFF